MAAIRTLQTLLTTSRGREGDAWTETSLHEHVETPNRRFDVWDDLRQEIARARRFGRSFALVRIERIVDGALASRLRTVDCAWNADGRTFVLLPEVGRDAADGFVTRVRREAPDVLAGCAVSVAAFPEDGMTSGALLEALHTTDEPAPEAAPERSLARIADSPPVHA